MTKAKKHNLPGNEIKISNRFSLLSEDEDETFLIGDSLVKEQAEHFGINNKKKRKTISFPGAGARKIGEEIKKVRTKNRKSTIIIQGGGNDLFLKNGNAGPTEPLFTELEKIVETLCEKTDNGIVVGLLPRNDVSHYSLSKAIGLNSRLQNVCSRKGVRFVNYWDRFIGNRKLYRRDGIHLNDEGKKLFGSLLNEDVFDHLKEQNSGNRQHLSNTQDRSISDRIESRENDKGNDYSH